MSNDLYKIYKYKSFSKTWLLIKIYVIKMELFLMILVIVVDAVGVNRESVAFGEGVIAGDKAMQEEADPRKWSVDPAEGGRRHGTRAVIGLDQVVFSSPAHPAFLGGKSERADQQQAVLHQSTVCPRGKVQKELVRATQPSITISTATK